MGRRTVKAEARKSENVCVSRQRKEERVIVRIIGVICVLVCYSCVTGAVSVCVLEKDARFQ